MRPRLSFSVQDGISRHCVLSTLFSVVHYERSKQGMGHNPQQPREARDKRQQMDAEERIDICGGGVEFVCPLIRSPIPGGYIKAHKQPDCLDNHHR